MIYIFLSAFCSVLVSINLKLHARYEVNSFYAIVCNYPAAILLSWLFFRPDFSVASSGNWPLYTLLATLLLSIFYFISRSVRQSGMVLTVVAQRISLVLPLLAAFLMFGEHATTQKTIGLVLGLASILCSISYKGIAEAKGLGLKQGIFPLIVFAGAGVIDILLKKIALIEGIPFTTSLFFVFTIAAIMGLLIITVQVLRGKSRFSLKNTMAGLFLGCLNFGSIYFYLKALKLKSEHPSVVFSTVDITVVILSSLVGLFLFREKLTTLNKISLALAIISIFIISFS